MLTLLLLCTATLTQASQGLTPEESQAAPKSDFPCPEAADILPCVCSVTTDQDLNLDCSSVVDDADLERVFKADFPFSDFTQLNIIADSAGSRIDIVNLNENVFQNITFSNIRISHTNLASISPTVFDKSAPRLETLVVTDNFITTFPFDVVDYAPLLTDLRVFRNSLIHMPEMSSDALTYLEIAYNPGLQYTDYALRGLSSLEYFLASEIELSHVGEDTFYYNTKLKFVDLSYNNLETLYAGSLRFHGPIEELNLSNNNIHTVEAEAISGLGTGSMMVLYMSNNYVESLTQSVWEPVFNSVLGMTRSFVFTGLGTGSKMILYMHNNYVVSLTESVWEPIFSSVTGTTTRAFVFDGNPFECSCNVLWLVNNAAHRDTITRGTICENTDTDILDVDVAFLIENC